jgi:class 3 adenylate cyclase
MAYKKSFGRPDERVSARDVTQELVDLGDFTVGRLVHEPGWRWSTHMKPQIGGDWCMAHHVGVVLSGLLGVELADGTTFEIGPDEVYDVPPGHDGYVIGDEPVVAIEWSGIETWNGFRIGLGERVLAGLLMTDMVGSTEEAARLGDAAWRHRLAEHHVLVRAQLDRFGGREIDTAGDGVFAMFDGAARALQCAAAIREASARQGIRIRAGVHVGEVELHGTAARGIAVHEVARIAAAALADEILVSESTYAISAGSGMRFEDHGEHELKGLDGPRRLFRYDGAP